MSNQRETIVIKDGDSSAGVILAVVAIVIVLALAWYFLVGPGATTTDQGNDTNITVELPSVASNPS